jgi:hypothetical protein
MFLVNVLYALSQFAFASGGDPFEFIPIHDSPTILAPRNWSGCSQHVLFSGKTQGLERYDELVNDGTHHWWWNYRTVSVEPVSGPDGIDRKILILSGQRTIDLVQPRLDQFRLGGRIKIDYHTQVHRSPSRRPTSQNVFLGASGLSALLMAAPTVVLPSVLLTQEALSRLSIEHPAVYMSVGGAVAWFSSYTSTIIAKEHPNDRGRQWAAFAINPPVYTFLKFLEKCYQAWMEFDRTSRFNRNVLAYKESLSRLASATEDSALVVFKDYDAILVQGNSFYHPDNTPWFELLHQAGLRFKQ